MSKTTKPMKTVIFKETGEVRPPKKGEWFKHLSTYQLAVIDFANESLPIYTMETERFKPEKGEQYRTITECLQTKEYVWSDDIYDKDLCAAGNCFPLDKDLTPIIEKLRKVFEEAQK